MLDGSLERAPRRCNASVLQRSIVVEERIEYLGSFIFWSVGAGAEFVAGWEQLFCKGSENSRRAARMQSLASLGDLLLRELALPATVGPRYLVLRLRCQQ